MANKKVVVVKNNTPLKFKSASSKEMEEFYNYLCDYETNVSNMLKWEGQSKNRSLEAAVDTTKEIKKRLAHKFTK